MRLPRLEFGQQAPGGVGLAQVAAQDGIDESRLGGEAALPGQLDGFVDGGMVGDAFEPENLVKAQPQEILQRGLLYPRFGLAVDEPIQGRLPADDAVGELLAQVTIDGRKAAFGQCGFEPGLYKIPARAPLEDAQRNFSWFLGAHNL